MYLCVLCVFNKLFKNKNQNKFWFLMRLTLDVASFNCLHEYWFFAAAINDFTAI